MSEKKSSESKLVGGLKSDINDKDWWKVQEYIDATVEKGKKAQDNSKEIQFENAEALLVALAT